MKTYTRTRVTSGEVCNLFVDTHVHKYFKYSREPGIRYAMWYKLDHTKGSYHPSKKEEHLRAL